MSFLTSVAGNREELPDLGPEVKRRNAVSVTLPWDETTVSFLKAKKKAEQISNKKWRDQRQKYGRKSQDIFSPASKSLHLASLGNEKAMVS